MDSQTRLLYWLLDGSRGGPTRLKLLRALDRKPANMRQLSLAVRLDYKTVQGHVQLLVENGILDKTSNGYGAVYFIGSEWEKHDYLKSFLRGECDENEKGDEKRKG